MELRGSTMENRERLMWFLIGASLGAGVALLYAPYSGKDARKLIRRKAEDMKDSLAETGENIVDAGKDVYRKGAGVASGAAGLISRVRG
jgi:gas vesicle protein